MKAGLIVVPLSIAACLGCGHHKTPADHDAEMRNAAIAGVRGQIGVAEIAFFPDIGHIGQVRIDGSHHTNSLAGDCIVRKDGKLFIVFFGCNPSYNDGTFGTGHTRITYFDKLPPKVLEVIARRRAFPQPLVDELLAQK